MHIASEDDVLIAHVGPVQCLGVMAAGPGMTIVSTNTALSNRVIKLDYWIGLYTKPDIENIHIYSTGQNLLFGTRTLYGTIKLT